MAVDFNACAVALAVRFAAAAITPPSGERDIVLSTSALPQNIVQEPTVLVFPPGPDDINFRFWSMSRGGTIVFPVRFYLWRIRDNARNATLCLKWLGPLYAQLDAEVHLGQENAGVQYAVIRNMGIGRLTYSDGEFDGITLDAEVHIAEALNPSN